ncbi:MAG TPA: hypothetical protein VJ775_05910 [Sphingomicrobium sp.]|nr:hypothetical protein [Sphingomicrobium sp.]
MASYTKYNTFADELSKGGHNLQTATFKAALTNTAPTAASDTVWNTTVAPAPAAANGYTAGGNTLTTSSAATTSGVFKLVLADSTFTASGGQMGPFRYVIVYNSSASNKVVGYYDYGSSVTLNDTEQFVVDFDATNGVLQLS